LRGNSLQSWDENTNMSDCISDKLKNTCRKVPFTGQFLR
jgi:hypothetical protein